MRESSVAHLYVLLPWLHLGCLNHPFILSQAAQRWIEPSWEPGLSQYQHFELRLVEAAAHIAPEAAIAALFWLCFMHHSLEFFNQKWIIKRKMFQRQQLSNCCFSPEHEGGLCRASVKLFLPAVYFFPSGRVGAATASRRNYKGLWQSISKWKIEYRTVRPGLDKAKLCFCSFFVFNLIQPVFISLRTGNAYSDLYCKYQRGVLIPGFVLWKSRKFIINYWVFFLVYHFQLVCVRNFLLNGSLKIWTGS